MNAMIIDTTNKIPAHHSQHRDQSGTENWEERKQHAQRLRLVKCGLGLRIRA